MFYIVLVFPGAFRFEGLASWGLRKMAGMLLKGFSNAFCMKMIDVRQYFIGVCLQRFNCEQWFRLWSCVDKWQAFIWTKNDGAHWHIGVSRSLNEISQSSLYLRLKISFITTHKVCIKMKSNLCPNEATWSLGHWSSWVQVMVCSEPSH